MIEIKNRKYSNKFFHEHIPPFIVISHMIKQVNVYYVNIERIYAKCSLLKMKTLLHNMKDALKAI